MNKLAPVCLFTYNRLSQTVQTVEALKKNFLASQSDLYIFSDGPKSNSLEEVQEVRNYIKNVSGFKSVSILESSHNKGLANSIIEGVSSILENSKSVIVLEDDLITTPNFLDFMNRSLSVYESNRAIKSINGFSLKISDENSVDRDVYFHSRPYSWGWATWDSRWDKAIFSKDLIRERLSDKRLLDFGNVCGLDAPQMLIDSLNGIKDSWYARWMFAHYMEKKLSIYPFKSKIYNVGFGPDGTHCKTINIFTSDLDLDNSTDFSLPEDALVTNKENKEFLDYFTVKHKIFFRLSLLRSLSGWSLLYKDVLLKLGN